jgi:hypothetical protein
MIMVDGKLPPYSGPLGISHSWDGEARYYKSFIRHHLEVTAEPFCRQSDSFCGLWEEICDAPGHPCQRKQWAFCSSLTESIQLFIIP